MKFPFPERTRSQFSNLIRIVVAVICFPDPFTSVFINVGAIGHRIVDAWRDEELITYIPVTIQVLRRCYHWGMRCVKVHR